MNQQLKGCTHMMIAITGAAGQLGRLVVNKLKSKVPVDHIVALVRTPAKATDLGVTVRAADYTQPDTLERALSGVQGLLLISSNDVGKRAVQHRNVIEAAKKAGVQWIVYTSMLHADTSAIKALSGEHLDTEADLKASGVPYTILRNGWYTENYTASVPGAVAGGAFLGSADGGKISSAARADYAEAAVAVLTSEGHEGKTYELAGDKAYTLSELAAEISRQTGKTIPYKNLSEAEYAKALAGFGLPAPVAQLYASFDTGAAQGSLFEDGHQLSRLIGHSTTPLATSVADALKA
jgi:NAD(P)H dehydrogenase (quinone)